MANKSLCIFILIATIVAQATWVRAASYTVGDDKGWELGVDYQAWVRGKEFYHDGALVFNFVKDKHNVVSLPDQASFDNCNFDKPIWTLPACGWNQVYAVQGDNFYTSSKRDDCKNGMKFPFTAKGPR